MALVLLSLAAAGAILSERAVALGAGFTTANTLGGACAGLVALILAITARRLSREGAGRGAHATRLDREIEGAADRFHTAWRFESQKPEPQLGFSEDLIEATKDWCNRELNERPQRLEKGRNGLRFCSASLIVAALLTFFALPRAAERRARLGQALVWLYRESPTHALATRTDSGNLVVPRGSTVTVWVDAVHDDGPSVNEGLVKEDTVKAGSVAVDIGTGAMWRRFEATRSPARRWQLTIPAVVSPVRYSFSGRDWTTPLRSIEVVDPPRLERLHWEIVPPAYTHKPKRELDREVWDLTVPQGAELIAHIQSDQALREAELRLGERHTPLVPEPNSPQNWVVQTPAGGGGPFSLTLVNELGLLTHSATGQLSIVRDATPSVVLLGPGPVTKIEGNETVEIRALAKDDYGVGVAVLVTERNTENSTRARRTLWTSTSMVSDATRVSLEVRLVMEPFDLYPGDEVIYWLEATDTDGVNGPKTGQSDTQVIRFPSLAEVYDELFAEEEGKVLGFQELLEEQRGLSDRARETAQDIRDRLEKGEEPPTPEDVWEERREIQQMKERQEELLDEYETIQQALEEMVAEPPSTVERETGLTPEVFEKLERIQELMSDLVDEEGKQLLDKIGEVVDQMATEISPDDLDDMAYSFEEYEQDLDRTLEQLERTFQERELKGLSQVANDLQRRQEALQSETQRLSESLDQPQGQESGQEAGASEQQQKTAQRLAERQEQLRQDAEALLEAMEKTAQRMEETNPTGAEKLRDAREEALREQMEQSMQQASQSLSEMQPEKAGEKQEAAQQSLQQLAMQLSESQKQPSGGMSMEIDFTAMEEFFQRALFLSEWQESLITSKFAGRRSLRSLEEEGYCRLEARRLASQWDEWSRSNPFLEATVSKEFDAAARAMTDAMRQGEGRAWIGYGHPERALTHLNRSLWVLHQNLRNLAMQASGGGSSEQLMNQLQQLAQRQRQLNEQSEQMDGNRMQHEEGLRQALRRMAQQQAQIRREIQRMMRQFQHLEEMQGRLEHLAAEMREIEEELQGGTLDSETRDRQNKLLMRMLDAQVSQEQDLIGRRRRAESSEEVKSQPAGDEIRLLGDPDRSVQVDDTSSESGIPPAYRGWVRTYLRELNRLQGGPTP